MVATSTEITVYDRVDNPVALMESLGKSMYESRMFGCTNEAQGRVLALACIAENKNPIELARVYHIIDGRLSMRADAMLAEFRKLGGKVTWVATGDDGVAAKAKFSFEGSDMEVGFTIEDAKRAALIKPKGNWEKFPGEMLRARTVSKAMRMLAPEIVAGYYTPEEIEDMDGNRETKAPAAVDAEALAKAVAGRPRKGKKDATETKPADDVIDAEFEVVKDDPKPDTSTAATTTAPAATSPTVADNTPCSAADSEAIKNLFATLGMTHEQQTKALAKRGAQAVRNLTAAQAAELLAALEAKAVAAAKAVETSPATTNISAAAADTEPCTPDQVAAIKGLLSSLGDPELVAKIKAKLNAVNLTLAQLYWRDANKLEQALRAKEMEAFFAANLKAAAVENAPFDASDPPAVGDVNGESDPAKN